MTKQLGQIAVSCINNCCRHSPLRRCFLMMWLLWMQLSKTTPVTAYIRTTTAYPLRRQQHAGPASLPRALLFHSSTSSSSSSNSDMEDDEDLLTVSGYQRPKVQWYPGHIAKAERQLQETIKAVDVVLDVRDGRLPAATAHPKITTWCAGKPRLIVYTHADVVPKPSMVQWKRGLQAFGTDHPDADEYGNKQIQNQAAQAHLERSKYALENNNKKKRAPTTTRASVAPVQDIVYVNAKEGAGIHKLVKSIFSAGQFVQERRQRRGLLGRPLRVGVLGYPNVGKSALINKLIGRKRAKTANTPGVTRSLQWIRIRSTPSSSSSSSSNTNSKEFELLDSPGIIPNRLENQSDAMLLAACNCIGTNAYDNQAVAAYLCQWLLAVYQLGYESFVAPSWRQQVKQRYKFDPIVEQQKQKQRNQEYTGEDILYQVADNTCQGDPEDAARKILQDFRQGRMGPVCLQVAPQTTEDRGQVHVLAGNQSKDRQKQQQDEQERQQQQYQQAIETAKARGLELPPTVTAAAATVAQNQDTTTSTTTDTKDVGKGLFDGW